MDNSNRLVNSIKQISLNTIENSKLTKVMYGVVTEEDPLVITVDQRLPLNMNQLVLSRNVTDYEVNSTLGKFKILNKLKIDEEVILLRQEGGQQFLVLDRRG